MIKEQINSGKHCSVDLRGQTVLQVLVLSESESELSFSIVAGQNVFFLFFCFFFFWGGGGNMVELNLGGYGKKILENFEILIPQIAAKASNFKN